MSVARRISLGLFIAVLGAAAAFVVHLHREGYRAYIIHTGSMTGTYNTGDLVIDRPVTGPLHVGEVITFLHSGLSSDVVTHRIVSLKDGTIQTKGDANQVADTWDIRPDQVKGVVTSSIHKGGYVAYFFKRPAGDAAAMTALLAMILLWTTFFSGPTEERAEDVTPVPATRRGSHRLRLTSAAASAAAELNVLDRIFEDAPA